MKANRDASAAGAGGAPCRLGRKAVQPNLPHRDFASEGSSAKTTTPLKFRAFSCFFVVRNWVVCASPLRLCSEQIFAVSPDIIIFPVQVEMQPLCAILQGFAQCLEVEIVLFVDEDP